MTNRHTTAGIMSIIAGGIGIVTGLGMAALFVFMFGAIAQETNGRGGAAMPADIMKIMQAVYGGFGIVYALIGVLGIIGGIFALKRKNWGLALTGAIAGSIAFYPTGIVGVIFVSLAKSEFETPAPAAAEPKPPISAIPGLPDQTALPQAKP